MTPEQALFLADQYVTTMQHEVPTTLSVLKAVPDSGWSYRPDPKSRTAGDLVQHIAQVDPWFVEGVVQGKYTFDREASAALLASLKTTADAVAYYERSMPEVFARVRALSGEDLLRTVDFFGKVTQPAVQFLSLANNHGIHHRGQLAAYLRAMGARVPAIYGPSGDEDISR